MAVIPITTTFSDGRTATSGPAIVPSDYRQADREQSLLDWAHIDERMTSAENYWVSSTRPNSRPHVMPTWGVWHEARFYFDGSPETRRMRNIAANPHIAVHLDDGVQAVILEGTAAMVERPAHSLTEQLAREITRKYAAHGYSPEPTLWDEGGLYCMQPTLALAWTEFGVNMTRWVFRQPE